jgi:hypothetical protein
MDQGAAEGLDLGRRLVDKYVAHRREATDDRPAVALVLAGELRDVGCDRRQHLAIEAARGTHGRIEPTLEHGHLLDGEVPVPAGDTAEDQEGRVLEGAPLDGVELLLESHRRLLSPWAKDAPRGPSWQSRFAPGSS